MASDDLYGPSNRELRVQDRLDKRRKKKIERRDRKASRTPLFKKDGKNCDDQGCWDPNNPDAPSANRKKRRRPPIPKPSREIISNKVVTDRDSEKEDYTPEPVKDALDIEYHRHKTYDETTDRKEWTDEDGTKRWSEKTYPDPNKPKDDEANVKIVDGKVVSTDGELTDEQKEKIEKYKKESADASVNRTYTPTTTKEYSSKERHALKAKKRGGYKPLSGYEKTENKTETEGSHWTKDHEKALTKINRRGKSKTYKVHQTGSPEGKSVSEGGHYSKKGTIVKGKDRWGNDKVREVDADRLEKRMGRMEGRLEKRVKRQGDRFKVKRDPDKMERYRDAVKASRQDFRDNRRAEKGKSSVEVAKAQREAKRERKKSEKLSDREYRKKTRKTTTFKQRRKMKY